MNFFINVDYTFAHKALGSGVSRNLRPDVSIVSMSKVTLPMPIASCPILALPMGQLRDPRITF